MNAPPLAPPPLPRPASSAVERAGLVPPAALDASTRAALVARLAADPACGWLGLDAAPARRGDVAERLVDAFLLFLRARFEAEAAEAEALRGLSGAGPSSSSGWPSAPPAPAPRAEALGCAPAVAAVWAALAELAPEAYGRLCEACFGRLLPVEPAAGADAVAATWAWLCACPATAAAAAESLARISDRGDDHAGALAHMLAFGGADLYPTAQAVADSPEPDVSSDEEEEPGVGGGGGGDGSGSAAAAAAARVGAAAGDDEELF